MGKTYRPSRTAIAALVISVGAMSGFLFDQALERKWLGNFEPLAWRSKTRLYENVRSEANTNDDAITGHLEWAKVYDEFDMIYDVHLSNPRLDFSKSQMKQYLANHR